jgi:hypothetical protein
MPRKKIKHGSEQRIQYFHNGSAIGEIILPKRHRDRRYCGISIKDLEQRLFERAIAAKV